MAMCVEQSEQTKVWYVRDEDSGEVLADRETKRGAVLAMRRLAKNRKEATMDYLADLLDEVAVAASDRNLAGKAVTLQNLAAVLRDNPVMSSRIQRLLATKLSAGTPEPRDIVADWYSVSTTEKERKAMLGNVAGATEYGLTRSWSALNEHARMIVRREYRRITTRS